MSDLLLPEGVRLVHIGPPKTATTSLQASFHAARPQLEEHGVHYAGRRRHEMLAVVAAVGGKGFLGGPEPDLTEWNALLADMEAAGRQRVVLSSEYLAQARPQKVRRLVDEIGREDMHVVLTLRPLDRLIPSQWQQYVQTGYDISYDEWLREMFSDEPRKGLTPTFWVRHRHDQLTKRWADVVGPENVTVVVLDPRDHELVLRVFEQLVGLPDGLLELQQDLSNRSLTLGEVEVVREFNRLYREAEWPSSAHFHYLRNGVINELRTRQPGKDEPKIVTPAWAQDRMAALTETMVANLRTSGVRVVGDLDTLVAEPAAADAAEQPESARRVSAEVASLAMVGAMAATGDPKIDASRRRAWRPVDDLTTRELAGLLRRRLTTRHDKG
ncbi:hypothetical protein FE697_011675 [Mumia zhuanghuii]|uniref:Sulfotransferase family protein n=2 Tax=Mumia TaxID=1546255 RepID=A0ABW1QI16_9ACTN|nr:MULTISPECIES: hypothetical protein [Mumia]KAA1422808.1 hypothetical protein FE697_011675 [Mumia zhuanghuii]